MPCFRSISSDAWTCMPIVGRWAQMSSSPLPMSRAFGQASVAHRSHRMRETSGPLLRPRLVSAGTKTMSPCCCASFMMEVLDPARRTTNRGRMWLPAVAASLIQVLRASLLYSRLASVESTPITPSHGCGSTLTSHAAAVVSAILNQRRQSAASETPTST